jgi:prepilin-type N-terminal cleavage/methylation domain-containing protein
VRERRRADDEHGFTIIETSVALAVLLILLSGLVAAMTVSVAGIVIARQRTGGVALADDVIEQARGRSYDDVGHDLATDPTLVSDSALSSGANGYTYNSEPLVGSVVRGANAPFSPHRWEATRDGTPYTVTVYVTLVTPTLGNGDPYKRLTVRVGWTNRQFGAKGAPPVVVSSFLFSAAQPPDPLLVSIDDADGGSLTLTGSLNGISLDDAHLWFPYSHAEVQSRFIRTAKGYAGSARSEVRVAAGSLTGCNVSSDGTVANCSGVTGASLADNDAGTPPMDYDKQIASDGGHTISALTALNTSFGSGNSVTAESAAQSHGASACPGVLGNDQLPFQCSDVQGPSGFSMGFTAGQVTGNLATATSSPRATATADRLNSGSTTRITGVATTFMPAVDLVTLAGAPLGYLGLVRISAASATATAAAGPSALAPTVTGSPITVSLYDTTLLPTYKLVTVTPGEPSTAGSTALIPVGSSTVSLTASVTSAPRVATSSGSSGAVNDAEASLTNWLRITVHMVVSAGGSTQADLNFELDYGRLVARATYQPA